jgi:D-alanyl-D-alanine carboxypeptidase
MTLTRVLAAAVTAGVLAVGSAQPVSAAPRDPVRESLEQLTGAGFPAALAAVTGRDGRTRDVTAGVGDLRTGAAVPADGRVRIGSNTKTFTAVVALQLVAEKKVGLDSPVDTYLPGLLRGEGIDGRRITVRQLLQHTSGLPNYTDYLGDDFAALWHRYFEPRELLDLALAHPAKFAPGARWEYSNTNYVVVGLLIQKVTGRPVAEEITDRVIRRAGLRHTSFPAAGDQRISGPHPHGYQPDETGKLFDVTVLDPSWGWAAGQMIATPRDLNTFYAALIAGRLLPAAQLRQMRTTVPADALFPGARYGLGLLSFPLSCGGLAWGHGGGIPGYVSRNGVTEDGRAATVAVTSAPTTPEMDAGVRQAVDTALCD